MARRVVGAAVLDNFSPLATLDFGSGEKKDRPVELEWLESAPVLAFWVRGLVYAVALLILVVFWPSELHQFVYQGF